MTSDMKKGQHGYPRSIEGDGRHPASTVEFPCLDSLALHRAVVSASTILVDLSGLTRGRLELHGHVHMCTPVGTDSTPATTTGRRTEHAVRLVDLLITAQCHWQWH